jgi:hypothetical protein
MHACMHACVQVFRDEGLVYMVLEYGDIDLARLLHNHEEARRRAQVGAKTGRTWRLS